jgi:rhodanese-related sulfurtransferase
MTADELVARISEGIAPPILDVRSRAEFDSGHVPGALHFPFWKLLTQPPPPALIHHDPDRVIVVYCGHGPRARLAGAGLRRHGFRRVEYLEGHMSGWRRRGLPEEK